MLRNKTIAKDKWQTYFDSITRQVAGKSVEIEIVGIDIGDQTVGDWIGLKGLSYDPESDVFCVSASALEHFVHRPKEIQVIEDGARILALGIRDSGEQLQVIKLSTPLALPEAAVDNDVSRLAPEVPLAP